MLSLLAGALFLGASPAPAKMKSNVSSFQDNERLRTILPNGAIVWAEHVPHAGRMVVQLYVSSRSLPLDLVTNGKRHLLEHLTALGRNRDLDQKLETQGAFLTAETLRDATVYQICLRSSDIETAMIAVRSVMQLGEISSGQIATESEIIRQESLLPSISRALSAEAWKAAFGDQGADPLGDPVAIAKTAPVDLAKLHQQEFQAGNLTLTISGDVDVDTATAAAKDVLSLVPSGQAVSGAPRPFLHGGNTSAEANGEAVAVYVDSWNSPRTAARLAAALCIAAGIKDSFVTYTPSILGSLIIVGRSGDSSGLDKFIASLNSNAEFDLGRTMAKNWVEREQSVQAGNILTGLLLSEGAGQRTETMLQNLDAMTPTQFAAALDSFRSPEAVHVIGK